MNRCDSLLSPSALRAVVMLLLKVNSGDDATLPDPRDQVIFADDPFSIDEKILQHVERLRLDMHLVPVATQLAFGDIERIVLKLVDHESLGPQGKAGVSRMKSKTIPKTPAATTA